MINILPSIIEAANISNAAREGDYVRDGLLYCSRCNTPKQTRVEQLGNMFVGCMCKCAAEAYDRAEEERKKRERMIYIASLPIQQIQDRSIGGMVFSADDGGNPVMSKARTYAEKWPDVYSENLGLLLWGNTGNGKTFAAACIFNDLKARGEPVLMTSFAKIMSAVTGLSGEERIRYINSLRHFKLLVIDDLGAERESSFALEQVYSVVDARYKNRQPLIVTTNLTLDEIKNPKNMDYQRIYDRILEMCTPVNFTGDSRRKVKASEKLKQARSLFED